MKLIRARGVSVYAGGLLLALCAPVACGDGDSGTKTPTGAGAGGDAGNGGESGQAGQQGDNEAGTGAGPGSSCPSVVFVNPENGAKLTEADDVTGPAANSCVGGFQYDVKVFTSAADGTKATLFSGSNQVAVTTVAGGFATFAKAQLSVGVDELKVQVGTDSCAPGRASVNVSCDGVPTCDITKPAISVTHPALNGIPVAQGGDRASAVGSPYQAAFEVTTNIEDGNPVSLQINSSTQLITTLASGGKATFAGVPLSPDGQFNVVATCQAKSGKTSKSGVATFQVDTTAPSLSISAPVAGKHFGPSEDSDTATAGQQFQVCGVTSSADALNLPSNLGAAQKNFCVALGTATPVCAAATGNTTSAPCVTLTCRDRVPFDLKVTLADQAGNTAETAVQGVSCTSGLPGVAILDPVDGTGADVSTHILAATATNGRKDEDGAKGGAQFTVTACTDVPNGPMTLMGGVKGQTPDSIATTTSVAAVPTDKCPAGKSYIGKFVAAKLPESQELALGELVSPTELTVTVSDQGTVGTSPPVDVWVDSVSPVISSIFPTPPCGSLLKGTTPQSAPVTLLTSAVPVLATVTNNGTSTPYSATKADIGQVNLGSVVFGVGVNTLVATTVDPAGNPGALESPCLITVGNPPAVSWLSPSVSKLNISNDADPNATGWQGTLSVHTDLVGVSGATIQFSTAAGNLGAPVLVDGSGNATSPVVTLADAPSVSLTATTSDVDGRGIGSAKLTLVVDTVAPGAVTSLSAVVPPALRRQTTFHVGWTAPSDSGSAVASYDVRLAKGAAITVGNFDAQEKISYSGAPSAVGAVDGLDAPGRMIENDYYFAVAAIDKAGNRGPIATSGPTAAHFNSTILTSGVPQEMFGYSIDGSTSLDGDAYSDLIVGAYNSQTVYIYMGSATGYPSTATATITGSTVGFGRSAVIVGDIDSDGLPDLAVSSPLDGNGTIFIFKGRHTWPTSLQQGNADYVVQLVTGFAGSLSGYRLTRLGDFNADGVDDFAIGSPFYNGNAGRISVVYGVPNGTPFGNVSLPTDYGTRALAIDNTGGTNLGQTSIGLGRYYSGGGSTMVAGATGATGLAAAFHGLAAQVSPVNSAEQTFVGPLAGGRTGFGLAFLGGGGALPLVGVGSPASTNNPANGQVDLFAGDVASGPFDGAHAVYTDSKATSVGDAFGVMVVGTAFANGVTTSIIGDNSPDVVLAALTEAGTATHLYMMTGQNAITPGTRDIVSAADVSYPMPAGWQGCSNYSGPIKDGNGDTYGDLGIGEWRRTSGFSGQVLVLW